MKVSVVLEDLSRRVSELHQWLDDNAPYAAADQRHLDAATSERAYWHLGYQAALADTLAVLSATKDDADPEAIEDER
ncbi:MAG: hypothetical protein AAFR75_04370 [Pseudomonadota bacterium]